MSEVILAVMNALHNIDYLCLEEIVNYILKAATTQYKQFVHYAKRYTEV